jgi:hypothetical protein
MLIEHLVPNFIFGKISEGSGLPFLTNYIKNYFAHGVTGNVLSLNTTISLSMTVKGRMISSRRQDMQSTFRENAFALAMLMFISLWVMMIA